MGKPQIIEDVEALQSEVSGINTTLSDIVTVAAPNKILKLDANSKLPTSITGNSDGNSATATKLATSRTITATGDATSTAVGFDGSANINIPLTLANSGVTANTYKSVSVNAKGLVTSGTNPTTLSGFGITDAINSSDFSASKVDNGYFRMPQGMIIQWGSADISNSGTTVTFPMAFPTSQLSIVAIVADPNQHTVWLTGRSTTSATFKQDYTGGTIAITWIAIGY